MPKSNARKEKTPKRVLALPDLEHAKTAVLNSLTSASGQRTYDHGETALWMIATLRALSDVRRRRQQGVAHASAAPVQSGDRSRRCLVR